MHIETYPVTLVDDLRNGDRDAFVRFYELYRLPIYNLVLRLLHGSGDAESVTREVFVKAYRQILLHRGDIDLTPLVYRVAVNTCHEHVGVGGADGLLRESGEDGDAQSGGGQQSDLGRRFEQALQTLNDRQYAALLLNDVHGLRQDATATVFGLSADAAAALLFRASEEFRRAFDELTSGRSDSTCPLAETAAASAVGRRTLPDDETRKLREHAEYCGHCRATMAAWGAGAIGLTLFLVEAPLPEALQAAPVFGTLSPIATDEATEHETRGGAAAAASGSAAVVALLATVGRALASRAAAYAVAAVCFAAFLGLAVYVSQHEWQSQQLFSSPGPPVTGSTRLVGRTAVEHTAGGSVASRPSGKDVTVPAPDLAQAPSRQETVAPALARLVLSSPGTGGQTGRPAAPIARGSAAGAGEGGSASGGSASSGHATKRGHGAGVIGGEASRGGDSTTGEHTGRHKHTGKHKDNGKHKEDDKHKDNGKRNGGASRAQKSSHPARQTSKRHSTKVTKVMKTTSPQKPAKATKTTSRKQKKAKKSETK